MVDRGEGGEVAQESGQQLGVHSGGPLGDDRLFGQHNCACGLRVGRQQPPVHIRAVTQIRVVRLLSKRSSQTATSASSRTLHNPVLMFPSMPNETNDRALTL